MAHKELDWRPVRQFLKSRNIKEINFKNMLEIDSGRITKMEVNNDNEIIVTITRTKVVKTDELAEKRCLDLYVVLNNLVKNPSIDGATFKQFIASMKRTNKVQNILDAWCKKK